MWFSTFVLKNLLRRPIRSILTVAGIALAIGAVVSLLGISYGFDKSFSLLYETRGVDVIVLEGGITDPSTSALDETTAQRLVQLPGVRDVTSGLMEVIGYSDPYLPAVFVYGWEYDTFMFDQLKIVDGRRIRLGDRRCVMLGVQAARAFGKGADETIRIPEGDEEFTIVGVFESFSPHENGAMIAPLHELQELMGRDGEVTGFQIRLEPTENKQQRVAELCTQIEQFTNGQGRSLKLAASSPRDLAKKNFQLQMAHAMAWLTSAIALVIGTIGMANTMIMSVFERTREIGILRAIGWRRRRIIRMILAESLLLSLIGAVLGTITAVVLLRWLSRLSTYSTFIEGTVPPTVILLGFTIALAVAIAGAVYPASRAAGLPPTEAIRHE